MTAFRFVDWQSDEHVWKKWAEIAMHSNHVAGKLACLAPIDAFCKATSEADSSLLCREGLLVPYVRVLNST